MHTSIYMYMCVCMYTCICIYIYIYVTTAALFLILLFHHLFSSSHFIDLVTRLPLLARTRVNGDGMSKRVGVGCYCWYALTPKSSGFEHRRKS